MRSSSLGDEIQQSHQGILTCTPPGDSLRGVARWCPSSISELVGCAKGYEATDGPLEQTREASTERCREQTSHKRSRSTHDHLPVIVLLGKREASGLG
jgi:hypothetical protein